MRVKKISALALIVATASFSLTACNGSDGSSASADTNASTSASSSSGDQGSASDSSSSGSSAGDQGSASAPSSSGSSSNSGSSTDSGRGSGLSAESGSATSASRCKADNLSLSASATATKNEIVVNMKNTGAGRCSMRGFPGVQLVGPDGLGDTGPDAARTDASGSTVTIGSGEETRFLLRYIPDTSGSGKTYTRLDVTPPDEKVSEIVNLKDLAITIAAPSGGHAPDVYVDPIGYHVGSGK